MSSHPLTRYRQRHELTMEALAERVGVRAATISRIESRVNSPSFALAAALVVASGGELTADDFLPLSAEAAR